MPLFSTGTPNWQLLFTVIHVNIIIRTYRFISNGPTAPRSTAVFANMRQAAAGMIISRASVLFLLADRSASTTGLYMLRPRGERWSPAFIFSAPLLCFSASHMVAIWYRADHPLRSAPHMVSTWSATSPVYGTSDTRGDPAPAVVSALDMGFAHARL